MDKLVKIILTCVFGFICFYFGWAYGQSSTYEKLKNSPELWEEIYGGEE